MGVGRSSLCWMECWYMGCSGRPSTKPSPSVGDTPCGITSGTLPHRPKGCVCREDILGYLYSHFIYNLNSKTETIKYIDGQVHSRQREQPNLSTNSPLNGGKIGMFSSYCWPCPSTRATQGITRLPRLGARVSRAPHSRALGLEWLVGCGPHA